MKDEDRKENRRKNWTGSSQHKKTEISEEQKFLNKSKKRLKKQIEDTRAEEAWDDWESA